MIIFCFPIATYAFCSGHVQNIHVHHRYDTIRARYGDMLKRLQYRYQDNDDRWRGGITVNDQIGKQSGARLFGA